MGQIYLQFFIVFIVSSLCTFSLQASVYEKLVNREVVRSIDISSQIVKSNIVITLENTGESSASQFHVLVDAVLSNYLAYISATVRCFFIR